MCSLQIRSDDEDDALFTQKNLSLGKNSGSEGGQGALLNHLISPSGRFLCRPDATFFFSSDFG